LTHAAARSAAAALADLAPPGASFASDNTAGAHPAVIDAVIAANDGHVVGYGGDPWTRSLEDRFADLFDRPVTLALCFGGTGANVVSLHTVCSPASRIICAADAHIANDEADAPTHITRARMVTIPVDDGKLTPELIEKVAASERSDPSAAPAGSDPEGCDVVSVTQASEVGTVYSPAELTAVCAAAHAHGMVVHLDGARLPNALAAWGYGPERLADACRALAATGVDMIAFGGTKAGLLGAEALVFCNQAVAGPVVTRRKQATQTSSKMRFLAAQFLAGLDDGNLLAWAARANTAARRLADGLAAIPGVTLRHPVDANLVFVHPPPAAARALIRWTPFYYREPATHLVRFVASWDTTDEDVDRLVAGVRAATAAALAHPDDTDPGVARDAGDDIPGWSTR
jgi:threonine aldolase